MKHKTQKVQLLKKLRRSVLNGHPWLFDKAVETPKQGRAGEVVQIEDKEGFVALGYLDPKSPLRVRVLERRNTPIDQHWLVRKLVKSIERRAVDPLLQECSAYRVVHGEADGLPGLVMDKYDEYVVMVLDGQGAKEFYGQHLESIEECLKQHHLAPKGLFSRVRSRERKWLGDEPPARVEVVENTIKFAVNLNKGQKTGLFLDQRENRKIVGEHAPGKTVLNLFAYTGGFSLAAIMAGALKVDTVDISKGATESAKANAVLCGIDPKDHAWLAEDVFDALKTYDQQSRTFDMVICDPPSFVTNEKNLNKGLSAYVKLNVQALKRVSDGGLFFTASCSSHVTENHMLGVLAEASVKAKRPLQVFDIRGPASDHPVHPGFPEGRYLNFICARLD